MGDPNNKLKNGGNKPSDNNKSGDNTNKVPQNSTHLKRNSVDSDAKLNIVQRAILSYEGNLTLLSPETQRRLKLVNEKVKAQTDDDKIIKSKIHNGDTKRSKSATTSQESSGFKKPANKSVVGEPLLPTRDFLARYQLMNKKKRNSSLFAQEKSNSEQRIRSRSRLLDQINSTKKRIPKNRSREKYYLEIEKRSEISEEPIYIESQDSNSSENYYTSDSGTYQNIVPKESFKKKKKENFGDWTDLSVMKKITLKRKKNKRHVNHRNSQNASETKKQQQMNDTISFTDSNDTLINDQSWSNYGYIRHLACCLCGLLILYFLPYFQ
ncbi:rho guanine nucleotide exchange factor 26 [Caerostris extrusa]|uniref:Rho guanine nucleotide exchange factor 26 n=1 Tax=Caerostris extrusa TaxID=172846 RepID=A0AAV4QVE4_CAEEX|nr:rho guanine nucleotide exchange factor 26 [Caerostris extrusa]